jgi:hypothetical protein
MECTTAMRKQRVAFSGSRTFTDRRLVERAVVKVASRGQRILVPCGEPAGHGYPCAKGVDTFVHHWIVSHGLDHEVFHARWSLLGKRAGFVRNEEMIKKADELVAFLADGEPTKGTSHAIEAAQRKGIPVHLFHEGSWSLL